MRNTTFCILLLIALFSTTCHAKSIAEQIPFQNIRGAMIVDVKIDNHSYPMLFDCGATMCVTPQLWEDLHLEEIHSETYNDSQGNRVTSKRANLPPIQIGKNVYQGLTAMLLDINHIPGMNCYGIYGVIGPEIIRNNIWKIDFKNHLITISDTMNYNHRDFFSTPLIKRFNGQPWLYLKTATGDSILTCFDTGSNGYLNLNQKNVSCDFIKQTSHKSYEYGFTGSGGGGYGRIDTIQHVSSPRGIQIGDYTLKNANIKLHHKPTNILGTGIMKDFLFILDYQNNEILFKPNERISRSKKKQKENHITFGYSDSHIIVASLKGKSTKNFPPISVGAIVVAVNRQRINQPATPDDLCSLLTNPTYSIVHSVTFLNPNGQEQTIEF